MAHAQDIRTTAEGIETQEQIEILRSMNCDFLQGFALTEPLNRDDLVQCLSNPAGALRPSS
jgi:EAL domain-containing protein (putative c-di-GMP-specific phosphodiesterase class I)